MKRYIALLRGINISGKNKIPMSELKEGVAELGFADKIKSMWERGWYVGVPFASYSLQNSNAEIKRIKDRIASLQSAQAAPAVEEKESGYTYREDTQLMRVQLIFDDKPDADTRALLKANGFRWAPSQNAWQRQLTDNGKRAAREVISKL